MTASPEIGSHGTKTRGDTAARVSVWRVRAARLQKPMALGLTAAAIVVAVAAVAIASGAAWTEDACFACHQSTPGQPRGPAHASVGCWECHDGSGPLRAVMRPLGLIRMGLRQMWRRTSASPIVESARCRDCHEGQMTLVIETDVLRVRHADFADAMACQSCHPEHTPLVVGPILDTCAGCHDGRGANNSCGTCHLGEPPDIELSSGWMATVHLTGGEPVHGVSSFDTCEMCHTRAECAHCHDPAFLPHGSGPDWQLAHGATAVRGEDGCLTCHDSRQCDTCHVLPMPHEADWLPSHAAQTERWGLESCHSCHREQDCLRCHIRHIHPYGFDKWLERR